MSVRNPFFYRTFFLLVLVELVSIFGYLLPPINTIGFFVIVALVLVVALWKLEYGIYCVIAELVVGSKGMLFVWGVGQTAISIRIALWLIIIGVWCARLFFSAEDRRNAIAMIRLPMIRWMFAFFAIIFFAGTNGFFRNNFADVFLDANAWPFFLLLFPLLATMRTPLHIERVLSIIFSATFLLSIEALTILFIYAHDPLGGVFLPFYHWIRSSGVGEVTAITQTFSRVFFQSQIYTLVAFFILLIRTGDEKEKKFFIPNSLFLILFLASLLLSFSRSFWVAGVAALIIFFIFLFAQKISFYSFFIRIGALFCVAAMSVALVWVTMNFPYPRTMGGSFASLLEDRATAMQESGIGSRWSLLPPLLTRIAEHPFMGLGFGATVTYRSSDPRIVELSARGNNFYTTYAFEWGYLDLWLKFGLIGIFFYCMVLWQIGASLWRLHEYGWLFGLIALLVTNIFSPYLNHPLGIGYLLLCIVVCLVPTEMRKTVLS